MTASDRSSTATNCRLTTTIIDVAVCAVAALTTAVLGVFMQAQMLDDAYITYNHARNLSRFGKLVYSANVPSLTTTAPLYGILLGAARALGLDIPAVSNLLGMASILGTGLILYALCRRHNCRFAGAIAAMLLVTSPLLWLTLGLETCFFIMLVCGAFFFYDSQRYTFTAVFLALAVLTRADGLIPAALIAAYHIFVAKRAVPWKSVAAFVAVIAPVLIYLVLLFGSPIPATLHAKQAQIQLGITGFELRTSLLEGLGMMLQGWAVGSPLYYAVPVFALIGVLGLPRYRWVLGLAAWGLCHLAGYFVLRVSPYLWYYGALVPGVVLLVGVGAQRLASYTSRSWLRSTLEVSLMILSK